MDNITFITVLGLIAVAVFWFKRQNDLEVKRSMEENIIQYGKNQPSNVKDWIVIIIVVNENIEEF